MTDLRRKLLDAFAIEHREHIESIRAMLEGLNPESGDSGSIDLPELYRRLHSLKGAARATDLNPVESVAHRLETLVGGIQDGTVAMNAPSLDIIHSGLDLIEDWFAAYSMGGELPPLEAVTAAAEAIIGGQKAGDGPGPSAKVTTSSAPASSAVPPAEPSPDSRESESVTESGPSQTAESVRIDVESLDRMLRCAGDLMTTSSQLEQIRSDAQRYMVSLSRYTRELETYQSRLSADTEEALHLSGEHLRSLHGLVTSLRTIVSGLKDVSQREQAFAWRSRQLSRQLRSEVQQVRTVTAESVFGPLRKMVRDIARDEGRSVKLQMTGGTARADRIVLQELKDPLMHILRNAIAHGIEPAEQRVAAGKPKDGNLRVDIDTRGDRLELHIEDDGRGLDLEGINSTARASGLLGPDDPDVSDYLDAQMVLLNPGFSTAPAVSTLAGRGLGMSVVHKTVARLQGDLTLSRADSGGLAVSIAVPLSVAAIRVAVVKLDEETYALPTNGIDGLYQINRDELQFVDSRAMFRPADGEEVLSLTSLGVLLGGEARVAEEQARLLVAVLKAPNGRIAVAVDGVLAVQDVVVEDLTHVLPGNEVVAGTILLEGGQVAPLLNTANLVDRYRIAADAAPMRIEPAASAPRAPVILVVDDSITTRTLEKSILEANGYKVHLCVDGLDALEQLTVWPVDLVVSDVEMPRMDGFGLLKAMKRNPSLKKTPVILVTSRASAEDQERGLSLGADAYVIKQRFDQTDLLETIGQLL